MGLSAGLSISANALGVHQSVINIVSNNIANMNTEGYSKQRANLGTAVLGTPIGNSVSQQVKTSCGVELINVQRYTSTTDLSYYMEQLAKQAETDTNADTLTDVANLFDDLQGQGLESSLTSFYEALDNLNQYPTDVTARMNFLETASTLTGTMNNLSNNLQALTTKSVGDGTSEESLKSSTLYSSIESINASLQSLADTNKMISLSQTGSLENNNLLDQRDSILKDLAQYADFSINENSNGTVDLSLNGTKLVSGNVLTGKLNVQTAKQYDDYCTSVGKENTNTSNAVLMIEKSDGTVIRNANSKFTSGSLAGLLNNSDGSIASITDSLNTLASTVANVFNNLQTRSGAFYLDYSSGKAQLSNENLSDYTIFNTSDGSADITAANISVNSLLTDGDGYNKIAAAYFADYDPTNPSSVDKNAVGNANNVIAMINTKTDASGTDFEATGHLTLTEYYNSILSKVTASLNNATNAQTTQNAVVDSLDNKMSSETSVDLNEELTDLVKAQTAYTASARVFSACTDILDILVQLGE